MDSHSKLLTLALVAALAIVLVLPGVDSDDAVHHRQQRHHAVTAASLDVRALPPVVAVATPLSPMQSAVSASAAAPTLRC